VKSSFRLRRAISVLIVAIILAWFFHNLLSPLDKKGAAKIIPISRGTALLEIAGQLRQERIISASGERAFVAAAVLRGWRSRLQPGRYYLAPSQSPWEILKILVAGKVYTTWLTVPEGYTLNQIGEKLEENRLGARNEFMALCAQPAKYHHAFPIPGASLEGYLFPDSYQIDGRQGAADIIQKMLDRFDEVVWRGLFKAQPRIGNRSLGEIITLASLVEGEARRPEERPLIAGVLLNRLKIGMRLECDATVQYALGQRKERLSFEDLKVNSPYNTYLRAGLPPGPINNPGRASVAAALHPEANPYLFYVARRDGSHIFSRTYAEHLAAIAAVRREVQ
jgi:UPF0755 protein